MFENFPNIKKAADEAKEKGIQIDSINKETGEVTIGGSTVSGEKFMKSRENADVTPEIEIRSDGRIAEPMTPEERRDSREA